MFNLRAILFNFGPFLRNSEFLVSEIKASDDMFFTRTMAEVLEEQGFLEDALMIYNILVLTSPADEEIGVKIRSLKEFAATKKRRKGIFRRS